MSHRRQRVAVLMSVHNRSELTRKCLVSLHSVAEHATEVELLVFMTDDGCTDDTVIEARAVWPDIEIIRGSGDLYWASGMAAAELQALSWDPDFFLWLNDDVTLNDDSLTLLMRTSRISQSGIAVGATRDPDDGSVSYGGGRVHPWQPLRFTRLPVSAEPQQADTFEGNVVLISKDVHSRVGLIDGEFVHKFADLDYGLRARRAGLNVWQAPGFAGECRRNPESTVRIRGLRGRWRASQDPIVGLPWRSQVRYLRRHAGFTWPLLAGWSMARRVVRG